MKAGKEVISINQEVNVLRQYIDFSRLRLHQKDNVQFHVELEDDRQNIAPLLLLPFVENAFKHGLNTDDERLSRIDIGLRLCGNELSFTCANSYSTKCAAKRTGGSD